MGDKPFLGLVVSFAPAVVTCPATASYRWLQGTTSPSCVFHLGRMRPISQKIMIR